MNAREELATALRRLKQSISDKESASEYHKRTSEAELRQRFWKLWVKYDQEPYNIR